MIVWALVQLVFWVACMFALIGVVVAVILAPPCLAVRHVIRARRA